MKPSRGRGVAVKPVRKKLDFSIVQGDDWAGLYVGGKLMMEGHSLRLEDALDFLEQKGLIYYEVMWLEGPQLDRLHNEGNLPKKLDEVEAW